MNDMNNTKERDQLLTDLLNNTITKNEYQTKLQKLLESPVSKRNNNVCFNSCTLSQQFIVNEHKYYSYRQDWVP